MNISGVGFGLKKRDLEIGGDGGRDMAIWIEWQKNVFTARLDNR